MKRLGWYIVIVRQSFETTFKDQLNLKKKELIIDDVLSSEEFSGYVFVSSIQTPVSSLFHNFDGFVRFIGAKNIPQKFCNRDISKFSLQPKKHLKTVFRLGDQVIVKNGDLCDIQGEIVELKKRIVKIRPTVFHKIVRARIQDIEFI